MRGVSSLPKLEEGALLFTFLDSAGGEGVFLVGLHLFENCVDQCLMYIIELGECQIIGSPLEFVEPCAFWDGDLVALAFTGLKNPVVNVNESNMLAEDCTPTHLSPNFGVTYEP